MKLFYGTPADIDPWMELVTRLRYNFPGLETAAGLEEHRTTVLKFISQQRALCVKTDAGEIAGVLLFSRKYNMICCLGVAPEYRRRGVATLLMDEALSVLDRTRPVTVTTFREEDPLGAAPRPLYEKYGFLPGQLVTEFGCPNQEYVLYPDGSPKRALHLAVSRMTGELARLLERNRPSVYLTGSMVLDDYRDGWSDIDLLVLTNQPIAEAQSHELVQLRQRLVQETGDPVYRRFEGGMLSLDGFLSGQPDRVVYWGTGGQRLTERYAYDSFCRKLLLTKGQLLYGDELRPRMPMPDASALRADIRSQIDLIRQYAGTTGRSLYSYGWLLDIARCMYTLRTGEIAPKTGAGTWALQNGLCPDPQLLEQAVSARRDPCAALADEVVMARAETLGEAVQRFNDRLEVMLTTQSIAE